MNPTIAGNASPALGAGVPVVPSGSPALTVDGARPAHGAGR